MNKLSLSLLLICAALAYAAPVDEPKKKPVPQIIESGQNKQEDGSYDFHFRGEDGSFREENGVVKNAGTKDEHLEVNGSYSYIDADGKEVVVHYKAGDRGFVPEGNNIQQEISEAAKKVSEQIPLKENMPQKQ